MQETELSTNVKSSLASLGDWFTAHQPRLLAALALLVVGWLLALLLKALAVRLVRGVERIVPARIHRRTHEPGSAERHAADLIGLIVFWAVLLFFIAAAADALGMPLLGASITGIGMYVPRLLAAVLVMIVGMVLGNIARDTVRSTAAAAGAPFAPTVGHVARVAILVAAALVAVAELGVDITLVTAILSVALAAVLGGFALAFGVGARTAVSNIIGAHYLRQTYEIGHRVRFGDVEGTIDAITPVAVVLRVREGRLSIPAKAFSESHSMLLLERGER